MNTNIPELEMFSSIRTARQRILDAINSTGKTPSEKEAEIMKYYDEVIAETMEVIKGQKSYRRQVNSGKWASAADQLRNLCVNNRINQMTTSFDQLEGTYASKSGTVQNEYPNEWLDK